MPAPRRDRPIAEGSCSKGRRASSIISLICVLNETQKSRFKGAFVERQTQRSRCPAGAAAACQSGYPVYINLYRYIFFLLFIRDHRNRIFGPDKCGSRHAGRSSDYPRRRRDASAESSGYTFGRMEAWIQNAAIQYGKTKCNLSHISSQR